MRQTRGEPSIDCIAARVRLKYWRRVMTSGPSMLRALKWNKGRPTEWASAQRLGGIGLPSFLACHSGRAEPHCSQFDRCAVGIQLCVSFSGTRRVLISITCTECIGATGEMRLFISVKALLCHQCMETWCGACGTNFRTRLRLLDHLSDARRTHCRDVCNSGTVTKTLQCAC